MNTNFLTTTSSVVSKESEIAALKAKLAALEGQQTESKPGFVKEPLLTTDELHKICEAVKNHLITSGFGTKEEFAFVKGQRTKFIVRYKRWIDKATGQQKHSNSIELVNGLNNDARVIYVGCKNNEGQLAARHLFKKAESDQILAQAESLTDRIRTYMKNQPVTQDQGGHYDESETQG